MTATYTHIYIQGMIFYIPPHRKEKISMSVSVEVLSPLHNSILTISACFVLFSSSLQLFFHTMLYHEKLGRGFRGATTGQRPTPHSGRCKPTRAHRPGRQSGASGLHGAGRTGNEAPQLQCRQDIPLPQSPLLLRGTYAHSQTKKRTWHSRSCT